MLTQKKIVLCAGYRAICCDNDGKEQFVRAWKFQQVFVHCRVAVGFFYCVDGFVAHREVKHYVVLVGFHC